MKHKKLKWYGTFKQLHILEIIQNETTLYWTQRMEQGLDIPQHLLVLSVTHVQTGKMYITLHGVN